MRPAQISVLLGFVVALLRSSSFAEDRVDYARDVRPILAQNCFRCHGPDEKSREADLRLDQRAGALKPAESGAVAVVPGQPSRSEFIRRIEATDRDEVMPPPTSKKSLTAAQKQILRRWIEQGAEYQDHWSFALPRASALPTVKSSQWVRNPIDRFVVARLESAGFKPSPEADPFTLIRRVSLDLTGLPPSVEEVDAFLKNGGASTVPQERDRAYEQLVVRLLASPAYGERWARKWLDLARYADTNGYEKDRYRSIWPYRDWVINSLNADMPFDQFTIEQLAGDMLPQATASQRIATGFHRNTMLNEEGGIDPLEFRFHAMTDRVATTGTTWLGLTLGCVQCHTHKYDPITHTEYYRFMAFLNNADEPEFDVPQPGTDETRQKNLAEAAKLLAQLESHWPVEDVDWQVVRPAAFAATNTPDAKLLDDHSVLFSAPGPATDDYLFTLEVSGSVDRLKLEALSDPSLPKQGPGRTPHGNFVLSEIEITAVPKSANAEPTRITIVRATANAEQAMFPVANAFDGKLETGWAVHESDAKLNSNKSATFEFDRPVEHAGGTVFKVRLRQELGTRHTIGRVRLSVGRPLQESSPNSRRQIVDRRFAEWLQATRPKAARWHALRPSRATSNLPLLTVQPDDSVFVSGDTTKYDTYELTYPLGTDAITALRLEALPDERLPSDGPGLTYYEGTPGDFFLTEFVVLHQGQPVRFKQATETYAKNRFGANAANAPLAIDGDPQTGWSVDGRQGERHVAVFVLEQPLKTSELQLKMSFGRHFASSLGRFRVSATSSDSGLAAHTLTREVEESLLSPIEQLAPERLAALRQEFLLQAPELKAVADRIRQLRKPPRGTTSLVTLERPAENPRPTHRHHRGEFLQPKETVEVGLPAFLPQPAIAPKTRLEFARWLVSAENPLTARVTVNRHWAAFFGQGLVPSLQDFGTQGDLPSHPELLDWLAIWFQSTPAGNSGDGRVELPTGAGWSMKQLHRAIVMSATYRQSSQATLPEQARAKELDPDNRLLWRGPRFRLEAEVIRDSVLKASGLLSNKLGGPSVYPPQPASVTTEGTYGAMSWTASTGDDRYRRSLYTFTKRTAPFAMTVTFDGPSGEACIARRDVSNTPLQALTLLNDVMFHEAAQQLGQRLAAESGSAESKATRLFHRCLTRPPTDEELRDIVQFFLQLRSRFARGELKTSAITGEQGQGSPERAAWTVLARSLFNLDEAIVKE